MTLKLDENQQKAVEHFQGPALVVAGPGSGKTTVIKERILNLIQNHDVDPGQILAIAFTNAAADEMEKRLSSELTLKDSRPKICTLHVFGKDLIKAHYKQAGFVHEPNNIWDDKKIGEIINREKSRLKGEIEEKPVAIYKIEDKTTHQCYIGQTINPDRRKDEHFNNSSNRRLREAIQQKGKKAFDFMYEWVPGIEADREETYRINSYKRRAAVNLNKGNERIDKENSNIPITIYKIKSPTTVVCYFGQTTDVESIDKPECFEIIGDEDTWDEASKRIELEIEKHKNWAVFNDEDPLHATDSTRRRIEVFCEYFDVSYNEVLEHTQKFEHEMRMFDGMNEDIVKVKSHTYTERFKPEDISDPVLRAFAKKYEDRKTEAKAIDFLDMLILSANMLEKKENQDLLREYREKHRHVFVDEFQDISPIDFRLIKLFLKNLFAVGDDDQAIYGFRGGDSEIMQNFPKGEGVKEYKVTRNYRSSSTIVRHAKALIKHNPHRISKNLRAENSAQSRVEVLETSRDTVENTLLNELFPTVTTCETHFKENTPDLDNSLLQELTVPQKIGILARNWYEVSPIQTRLNSVLRNKGFQVCWSDSNDQEKRKLIMRRGQKEIEVSTIHSAKGREWEKVILLVNTMTYSRKASLPDERNDLEDERRLFYVAITRAKQELAILDGGNCRFISEFQNVPPTKEELEEAFKVELATRKLKEELEEASKAALVTLESRLNKELEEASKAVQEQYKPELNRLRRAATESQNEVNEIQLAFTKQLKAAKDEFLEGLMPVLDEFESQIKNLSGITESNNESDDFTAFTERVQLAHKQLLDSLKNHGLKPIEACGKIFNPSYHKKIPSEIYSDKVPEGRVAREEQRGYSLHDQVIRKTEVVVSKGQNIRTPARLDRIVEIYLNRLIASEFGPKYDLDKPTIKRKMAKYLSELDDESLKKINSAATIDTTEYIKKHPLGNYCVGQATTHMCTDVVFRNFWKHMWEVVEESKKTSKPKIKHAQPSVDPPLYTSKTRENTSTVLSRKIVNRTLTWDEIATAYETGTSVKGRITERIKGGLRVSIGSLQGFLPASQVESRPIQNLEQYVGQTLDMKVISLSKQRHNIVLSRRAWLEDELVQKRSEILNTLKVGQRVTGVVKNIADFGAFIDLGGVDGLLRKTEIAWKRINHPSEMISVGEKVEVKVVEFDQENEKISLSLKQMTTDPWKSAEEKYPVRSTIQGTVTNIVNFGAFVQLEEGIEGLIHVSKMPLDANNTFPSDFMNKNDEVEVIVLEISKDSKRISLGMKSDRQNPFEAKKVVAPSDEPPPIVKIATDISNELTEQKISGPIKEIEAETPIPKAPPIVAEDVNSHSNESTDSIIPKPHEEVVNTPPISKELSEILNSQIQVLKPETLETEIVSEPLETVDNNTEKTLHEYNDILNTHIEELKPEIPEIENPDNITKTLTLEIEADSGTPVDPTALTRSDSPTSTDSDAHQIKGEAFSENEVEHVKKNLGYYLRQGGRFAVEKIKGTIFRKPTS